MNNETKAGGVDPTTNTERPICKLADNNLIVHVVAILAL